MTLLLCCRSELFRTLIRQPVEFFDTAEVGVLTSRIGADCQAVVRCLSTNLNVALRNGLQCIGALQCHLSVTAVRIARVPPVQPVYISGVNSVHIHRAAETTSQAGMFIRGQSVMPQVEQCICTSYPESWP